MEMLLLNQLFDARDDAMNLVVKQVVFTGGSLYIQPMYITYTLTALEPAIITYK